MSCHKGLGLLGSGTGWDTVGALRHLSIVLSASEASSSTKAESRHPPSERCGGTPPRPVPFPRGWESCWCRSRPRAMSFSAARQPHGCPVYTWGDPYTRPPLALSPCHASPDYISRGARGPTGAGPLHCRGKGPARAAPLSQCGALRGGHVPLFGAFVRARGCWCSVRPGGSDRAGGCGLRGGACRQLGGRDGRDGLRLRVGSPREGWAGPRAPEGLVGGGRSALCVARAEPGLCPHSPGARLSWGRGAASVASLRREPPGAVAETIGGVGPRFASRTPTPVVAPLGVPIV